MKVVLTLILFIAWIWLCISYMEGDLKFRLKR